MNYYDEITGLKDKVKKSMSEFLFDAMICQFGDQDAFILGAFTLPNQTGDVTSEVKGWSDLQAQAFYKQNKDEILQFMLVEFGKNNVDKTLDFITKIDGLQALDPYKLSHGMHVHDSVYTPDVSKVLARYVASWVCKIYLGYSMDLENAAHKAYYSATEY